jgi:hypothetical protein
MHVETHDKRKLCSSWKSGIGYCNQSMACLRVREEAHENIEDFASCTYRVKSLKCYNCRLTRSSNMQNFHSYFRKIVVISPNRSLSQTRLKIQCLANRLSIRCWPPGAGLLCPEAL